MSEDTLEICRSGEPFRAVYRPASTQWVVRSRIGEDVAVCTDPDAAVAVAEAMTEAGKERLKAEG